jgi:hypothetical protein
LRAWTRWGGKPNEPKQRTILWVPLLALGLLWVAAMLDEFALEGQYGAALLALLPAAPVIVLALFIRAGGAPRE